jgi:hypothetical protein
MIVISCLVSDTSKRSILSLSLFAMAWAVENSLMVEHDFCLITQNACSTASKLCSRD